MLAICLLGLSGVCRADPALPVITLRYEGGLGAEEEAEEEGEIEPRSVRHSSAVRIKEEWTDLVTSSVWLRYTTKDYLGENGDYWYVYVKPELQVEITDRVEVDASFRSKWVRFADLDSEGLEKDYLNLTGGLAATYKPARGTRIISTVKGDYELYENEEKTAQSYFFGVRIQNRFDQALLSSNYTAGFTAPLGAESDRSRRVSHDFGVSLTWDPNR